MSTPLTDSINALTTYANEVTGASDTTLSDAVYTLAQGFRQGVVFEEVNSYTLTESWENDTDGNALVAEQTFIAPFVSSGISVFLVLYENNNASYQTYKADGIIAIANNGTYVSIYAYRYDWTQHRSIMSDISFWASEGTVIKTYKYTV